MTGAGLTYAAATAALWWGTAEPLATARSTGAADLDMLLTLGAAAGGWLCLTWLATGFVLTGLATLPRLADGMTARLAARITPAVLQRAVGLTLGLVVAAAPAAAPAASAGDRTAAPAASTAVGPSAVLALAGAPTPELPDSHLPDLDRPVASLAGWTPPRPPDPAPRQQVVEPTRLVTGRAHPQHAADDEVVVHRGDTLWQIAARHLGPDAGPAEVAAAWPRWYAANRDVIGPDPHLLLPGQQLRTPAAA